MLVLFMSMWFMLVLFMSMWFMLVLISLVHEPVHEYVVHVSPHITCS